MRRALLGTTTVIAILAAACGGTDTGPIEAELATLRATIAELQGQLDAVEDENATLATSLESLAAKDAETDERLAAVEVHAESLDVLTEDSGVLASEVVRILRADGSTAAEWSANGLTMFGEDGDVRVELSGAVLGQLGPRLLISEPEGGQASLMASDGSGQLFVAHMRNPQGITGVFVSAFDGVASTSFVTLNTQKARLEARAVPDELGTSVELRFDHDSENFLGLSASDLGGVVSANGENDAFSLLTPHLLFVCPTDVRPCGTLP